MGLTGLYELVGINRGAERLTFTELVQTIDTQSGETNARGLRIGEKEPVDPLNAPQGPEIGLALQALLRKRADDAFAARAAAVADAKRPQLLRRGESHFGSPVNTPRNAHAKAWEDEPDKPDKGMRTFERLRRSLTGNGADDHIKLAESPRHSKESPGKTKPGSVMSSSSTKAPRPGSAATSSTKRPGSPMSHRSETPVRPGSANTKGPLTTQDLQNATIRPEELRSSRYASQRKTTITTANPPPVRRNPARSSSLQSKWKGVDADQEGWDVWSALMVPSHFVSTLSDPTTKTAPAGVVVSQGEVTQKMNKLKPKGAQKSAKDDEGQTSEVVQKPKEGTKSRPLQRGMPFQVVEWSSQKNSTLSAATNLALSGAEAEGRDWTSKGSPEQWLILDFMSVVEVSKIKMRLQGTIGDPKDLVILQSDNQEGPWVQVKRFCIHGGPRIKHKQHSLSVDADSGSRYWKLLIYRNWGSASYVCITAPLECQARPSKNRMDQEVQKGLSGIVSHFCESTMLTSEDRKFRDFVREQGIDLIHAEEIRAKFDLWDHDGSGEIDYPEFKEVLKTLLHAKDVKDIPENRCMHFWTEVDTDQSGKISLFEFVVWFYHLFFSEEVTRSRHNPSHRLSTAERFYATLGQRRANQSIVRPHQQTDQQERRTLGSVLHDESDISMNSTLKSMWSRRRSGRAGKGGPPGDNHQHRPVDEEEPEVDLI